MFFSTCFSGFFRGVARFTGQKRVSAIGFMVAVLTPSFALALCLDISDVPMDTQLQAAPANIMFVVDDSGSMDWEFMTTEPSGIFHDEYYNFDMSDNAYASSNVVSGSKKKLWKARWSGYNKMYYNPTATYGHWPGKADADTTAPRSNPVDATPTLTLSDEYDSIETGVIVDNTDAGFTRSANGWDAYSADGEFYGSNYLYTKGNDGTAWARWTVNLPTPGDYEVFGYWRTYNGREKNVTYKVYHNGVSAEGVPSGGVDQEHAANFTDKLVSLGTYYFAGGGNEYIQLNATVSGDSKYTADAMLFSVGHSTSVSIKNAHYYVYSESKGVPYLVVLDGGIKFYRFSWNVDDVSAAGLVPDNSPPDDVIPKDSAGNARTYAQEVQNFANWFSFYRRRELTAKGAIARVIDGLSGVKVGFYSIHNRLNQTVLPVNVTVGGITSDETATLLNLLYALDSNNSTPLRNALKKVGYYFGEGGSDGGIGTCPYADAAAGGACQQSFAIVVTDGFWNGGLSTSTGNEDEDQGEPYADGWTRTLADVAMRFYKNDLAATLDDLVPSNEPDMANWQHMVTYGISFGVTGTLDPDDYDLYNMDVSKRHYPVWPDPTDAEDSERIDDLWHASVNGRGMFLSASDPQELIESLDAIMQNVMGRIGSGASISVNGEELHAGSVIYQASYSTDNWTGDVKAYGLDQSSGAVIRDAYKWSADEQLVSQELVGANHGNRVVATYNTETSAGIPFHYADLSNSQKISLDSDSVIAEKMVNYLRGETANEERNGGVFRNRNGSLGDIVHSSPSFFKGVVYAGANDGMLHAFDAATGKELFAYVPGLVFDNLAGLTHPNYAHRYYVDLTPYVEEVGDRTLLVGGLGKGGKGYYCLDVTNAKNMDEGSLAGNVKWEFPNSSTHIDHKKDMGYSYSEAYIVNSKAGWVVIFGNGYASENGNAVLFVLDVNTGEVRKKIDTRVGGCNGLSTPIPVDVDQDGKVDYVYAGDLKGNLWKFEFTDTDYNNWKVAYSKVSVPQPLFQAVDENGDPQPITTKPEVMFHCDPGKPGFIVVTGTGKYLGNADYISTQTQTIYGLWDYGDDLDDGEFLGAFDHATGKLSNQPDKVTLLEQKVVYSGTPDGATHELRVLSGNKPVWLTKDDITGQEPDPSDVADNNAGWYFDFPIPKERVIRNFMIRDGKVIYISSIPKDSPCSAGGDSILHEVDACTGGGSLPMPTTDTDGDGDIDIYDMFDGDYLDAMEIVSDPDNPDKTYYKSPGCQGPQFDINGDGKIDIKDMIAIPHPDNPSILILLPPSGNKYTVMIYPPKIMRLKDDTENKYFSTSAGNIERLREEGEQRGIFYWRQVREQ